MPAMAPSAAASEVPPDGDATAAATTSPTALHEALRERELGNACYMNARYEMAEAHYARCLDALQAPDVIAIAPANACARAAHANLAACALKRGRYEAAARHADLALAIDPRDVKALFRKGEALRLSGRYEEALRALGAALCLDEDSEDVRAAMDECEDRLEDLAPQNAAGRPPPRTPEAAAPRPLRLTEALRGLAEDRMQAAREAYGTDPAALGPHVCLAHPDGDDALGGGGGGAPDGFRIGVIKIDGAFESPAALREALGFVRSQHFVHTAHAAVVIAQKRDVRYPKVWWAHPWPIFSKNGGANGAEEGEGAEGGGWKEREARPSPEADEGVFVELHTREGHATWFLPAASDGDGLGDAVLLPPESVLAEHPMFP